MRLVPFLANVVTANPEPNRTVSYTRYCVLLPFPSWCAMCVYVCVCMCVCVCVCHVCLLCVSVCICMFTYV